ncbi:hypothetical protein T440DRAFT_68507 [Plenodomus tracheiphilus IPT5]|uniref:Uncharacterized protein n=1 Tax=Plenodomus tracheiphilus IPT5 TaxID=1408161 RepID=A0A6A7B8S4_9PLEO|nr:hypothetical protein T440DRAFT_68507 [Plenodomus tracheiphilus IPT5]
MCGCTLYDSPTCGHSWISMSQPCGFLADLLSCPNRQTYQTLIAPPYTCPTCNGGFADRETIEMVQGPWGCNQMLRNHVGGNYAVPGQWGSAPFRANGFASPMMTPGAMLPFNGRDGAALTSGALVSHSSYAPTYDHRLTGPYGAQPMIEQTPVISNGPMAGNGPMMSNAPMVCDGSMVYNGFDCYDDGYAGNGWDHGSRGLRKQKSKYKYRYTDEPAGNCAVM